MSILEKNRPSEGLNWFAGILGIVAVALIFWNSFSVVLYLLAKLGDVGTEMSHFNFLASALGLVGSVLLLIGVVLVARRIVARKPWLAAGSILLIAKNVVEMVSGVLQFMMDTGKSEETLYLAAAGMGSELGQLIFWCFVLWLIRTWVPGQLASREHKKADAPRLQGAQ